MRSGEQDWSKEDFIRFHVIANSNKEEDQRIKEAVRDSILEAVTDDLLEMNSIAESREYLVNNAEKIQDIACQVAQEWGQDYRAKVSLGMQWIPQKKYNAVTLPAGNYEAFVIKIGEGRGRNWWCVMFPPLCLIGEEAEEEVALGNQEASLVLKSKVVEIVEGFDAKEDESKPVSLLVGEEMWELGSGREETDILIPAFSVEEMLLQRSLIPYYLFDQVKQTETLSQEVMEITVDEEHSSSVIDSLTQEDVLLLAKTIYAEARGESYEGQVAVGAVVLNRLEDPAFPDSLREVVYQKGAFSVVSNGSINKEPSETSLLAAQEAIAGNDPTGGCLYFWNPKTSTSKWIETRTVVSVIGNHNFGI